MPPSALPSTGAYPKRGELLPDISLPERSGKTADLEQFRGRKNLVLLLAARAEPAVMELATVLLADGAALSEQQAEVVVIVCAPEAKLAADEIRCMFPVFVDNDAMVHRKLGAYSEEGPRPAVYITDKFREVFASARTAAGQPLPKSEDVIGWLEFINRQCEECHPPEWPASEL